MDGSSTPHKYFSRQYQHSHTFIREVRLGRIAQTHLRVCRHSDCGGGSGGGARLHARPRVAFHDTLVAASEGLAARLPTRHLLGKHQTGNTVNDRFTMDTHSYVYILVGAFSADI